MIHRASFTDEAGMKEALEARRGPFPRLFVNLVALLEQTNVARHPLGDTRPAARAFYATIINRPAATPDSFSAPPAMDASRDIISIEEKFSGCRVSTDPPSSG